MRGEYKEINRKIGARIRLARETAGLTRDEFSEKIGISAQFQTDIERGRTGPSITTLCKICDVLAVPTDSILRGPQPGVEAAAWQIGTLLRDVPSEFLPLIIENGMGYYVPAKNVCRIYQALWAGDASDV